MTKDRDKLNYFAGIFDGEGTIFIRTTNGVPTVLVMTVSNSDPRLMVWIKENFGGEFYESIHLKRPSRKKCWYWTCNSHLTVLILREILPYLIIKKEQVELAIGYSEMEKYYPKKGIRRSAKRMGQKEIEIRRSFQNKLKELKQSTPAETERKDIRENDATVRTTGKLVEATEMVARQSNFNFIN